MKAAAKAQGLWNLWISLDLAANMRDVVDEAQEPCLLGAGLSNLVGHLALKGTGLLVGLLASQRERLFCGSQLKCMLPQLLGPSEMRLMT